MPGNVRRTLAAVTVAAVTGGLFTAVTGTAAAAPARYIDDFDGDGRRDLAVGMPGKSIDGRSRAGAVMVTFDSASGLTGRKVLVSQKSAGVPGAAEASDMFGSSLAVGDLDRDGYADLVVSAEGEGVGEDSQRGSVTILWGGSTPFRSGTTLGGSGPHLGTDVAVADFTGDAAPELVATVSIGIHLYQGVFRRTTPPAPTEVPAPWSTEARQVNIAGIAAGNLMHDGKAELAVTGSDIETGRLTTLVFGSRADDPGSGFVFRQKTVGGQTVAIGNLDGDGRADLAVGVPYESLGGAFRTGDVLVLRGAAGGLTTTGARRFSQDTAGVPGAAETNDTFGGQVRLADFNGDGKADLAVSAPGENGRSGALWQLHGTSTGLTGDGADVFSPSTYGLTAGSGLGAVLND